LADANTDNFIRFFTAYTMRATSKIVETVWIFEKETTRLFDDTPIYEGVIIEYLHRIEVSHKHELHPYRQVAQL